MRVKVWNDNEVEWVEKFKGDTIKIPSKGFIEMEFYDAHEFKGQFSPIRIRADETQDPHSFKMIRVEQLKQEQKDELEDDGAEIFPCQLCKKVYTTEAALLKHSDAAHADRVVTDFEAEKVVPKKRGPKPKSESARAND